MTRRRAPNASEKIAAALLKIKIGVEGGRWLIPEPLRSEGTAREINASVQWDHIRRHAEDGDTRPQNIDPLPIADHRAKTVGKRGDIAEVAKGKRYGKIEAEHQARLTAKYWGAEVRGETKTAPKAKIRSRGFASPEERARIRKKYGTIERQS